MNASRCTAIYVLSFVIFATGLQAVPISVNVKRHARWEGSFNDIYLYVNNVKLGSVPNGQNARFRCDNALIGVNEVRVMVNAFGERPMFLYTEDKKLVEAKYFIVTRSGEDIDIELDFPTSFLSLKVSSEIEPGIKKIEFDRVLKEVVIKETLPFRVAPGSEEERTETMTVRREIRRSIGWQVDADLKANVDVIWASAKAEIKAKMEGVSGESNSLEITRTKTIRLRPSSSAIKLAWIEYIRTGTATVIAKGREIKIPFEVPDELTWRPIKASP